MTLLRAPALLLTVAMVLWSGNILLGRAMHEAFTPTALNFWRWVGALALLLPLSAPGLWRHRAALWRERWALLGLGVLGVTLFNWVLYQAVHTTTATNTALIYSNVPVFIVVVSWVFLGERIGLRQGAGIVLSSLGVLGILTRGEPAALLSMHFTPGDLWALASVPVWGLYTIWLRYRPPELSQLELMTAIVAVGLPIVAPFYAWEYAAGVRVAWNPRTLGTVAYLAVVASIVCFLLWNAGVARIGANRAGLYAHVYPLAVAVLEVLLLGEALLPYHFAGGALIFAGLTLTTASRGRPAVRGAPAAASADPVPAAGRPSLLQGWGRVLLSPSLLLVLNMLFWAGNWVVGRGLRGEITPLGLNFWRWSFVLAWLLPFTWRPVWAARAAIRRDWLVLAGLGLSSVAVFNYLVYLALSHTTALNAVLINSVIPVAIVLLSWVFLRERITWSQGLGIAISLGGVLAILSRGDPALLLGVRFHRGDLWALATVPVWAFYTVLLRRRPPELGPMALLTVMVIVGLVAMLPFALMAHARAPQVHLAPSVLGALLYVALFSSLAGVAFFNHGVARLGPNVAGLFIHLVPAFTIALAWLFLGERLQLYHGAGVALIVLGIYLTTIAGRRLAAG
jgi:drug/metabolite transporter (DMT)-like permease